jgi:hypothetical protein
VEPDVKPPAKSVSETLTGASGGRDGVSTVGDLFGDLKLEGLDTAQMNVLVGVTDDFLAPQMEILAGNEVSDSGEDTVGEDSDDEESFPGKGNHNPAVPEFKAGAGIVYLGQEGDEVRLCYDVAVHGDGKGDPPFYTAYLEGLGGKQVEGQRLFPVAAQDDQPLLCPPQSHPSPTPLFFQGLSSQKRKKEKTEYLKQMSEMAKIVQQQRLENKKLEKKFIFQKTCSPAV